MARINIEDDFWNEPRIDALAELVKDRDKAYGMMLRAIRLAQKYWAPKKGEMFKPIPFEIWNVSGLCALSEVGLTENTDQGVYLKGSKDHFGWLVSAKSHGRMGGLKRVQNLADCTNTGQKTQGSLKGGSSEFNHPTLTPNPNPSPKKKIPVTPLDEGWLSFGQVWLDYGIRTIPHMAGRPKWNAEDFGRELERVAKKVNLTPEQFREVQKFAESDSFWCKVVASPFGLLKKSDNGNLKMDNLLAAFIKIKPVKKPVVYKEDWGLDP